MAEPEKKVEQPKDKYVLGEVTTQTQPVGLNEETKEAYTELQLLIKILNKIERIEKNIVG